MEEVILFPEKIERAIAISIFPIAVINGKPLLSGEHSPFSIFDSEVSRETLAKSI